MIELPVHLWRMVANETSLHPGAGWRTFSKWRLERVEAGEEEWARHGEAMHLLIATIVESRPTFTSEVFGISRKRPAEIRRDDFSYFLVNHLQGDRALTWGSVTGSAQIDGVAIKWRQAKFRLPKVVRHGEWQEEYSPGWFDHATLARVELREAGWLKREIKVDRFELQDAPAAPELEP
jgi:hypothetical protein